MADKILTAVLARGEEAVSETSDALEKHEKRPQKKNIDLGKVVRYEAGSDSVLDAYVHQQNVEGVNAVLVEIKQGTSEVAHDVALHIASSRPKYLTRDEVPAEVVTAERETLENITRNEGKPRQAIEKIVDGRMDGFFRDNALLEQKEKFVKDEKVSISELLGGSLIQCFVRMEIGS